MTLDQFFKIFIAIHAICGSVSLLAGTISVIAKKGGKAHKKSGKLFYWGMLVAGFSGIIAAVLPGHYNPFLFVVGLFSVYLVITGYRALGFKSAKTRKDILWDIRMAYAMLVVGIFMMGFGIYILLLIDTIGSVLVVFGFLGLLNAINDLKAFMDIKNLRTKSLRLHIGKIFGAYIAAFTAFFVTNDVLPPMMSWLLPTVFGVLFIGYWLRKTKPKKKVTVQS